MNSPVDELMSALAELSSERLQRLVERLEREPDVALTVGSWQPCCPMVLAGFNPATATGEVPEQRFAGAWDRFATPRPRRRWIPALPWRTANAARPADVQFLLRRANAVLAARLAQPPTGQTEEAITDGR
jgi:hypothetical protein